LLAAIAEFERDLIRERTGEGRKRALAKGVKLGRKPKLSEYQRQEALKRRAAGETLAEIAKSYAVDVLSSDVDYLAVERSGSADNRCPLRHELFQSRVFLFRPRPSNQTHDSSVISAPGPSLLWSAARLCALVDTRPN